MNWFKERFHKKDRTITEKLVDREPIVKLTIVNQMHQLMALTVSDIAKIYPKQFDMIKHILMQYAFLIEEILNYRKSGKPLQMFQKLNEFIHRSVSGYLEKYEETDDVIEEEKEVVGLILDFIVNLEEAIEKYEGLVRKSDVDVVIDQKVNKKVPVEKWDLESFPVVKVVGGLPALKTPIEEVRGIGEKSAKKLRDVGVETLEDYVDYKRAEQEANLKTEDEK